MKSSIFLKIGCAALLAGLSVAAHAMDHEQTYSYTRAEATLGNANQQSLLLDGWVGGDKDRLWWQGDAAWQSGNVSGSGLGAWYGHYFAPFWDAQIGVRSEGSPNSANYFSIGVRGLAPYQYDTDLKLDVRSDGKWFVRSRFEQELLMSNQFILLPWLAADVSGEDIDATVRAGLYRTDIGLQARYEFTRKFAPFLEVSRTMYLHALVNGEQNATLYMAGLRFIF
jgi:copper resistance protein B